MVNSIDSEQIQYAVHPPSAYVSTHLRQLLPDWSVAASSMVLVLQRSQCTLFDRTPQTEADKDRLRNQFLALGLRLATALNDSGYAAEVFDPKTGFPILSSPGSLMLDDVAIARTVLGYASLNHGDCSILLHPTWGSAVYPSTLISSAPCYVLAEIVNRCVEE
ncbi:MAG: methylmalonic aciduria and homocystinuria type D protein [Oculatellaceae cyanobacterium bins.114]|nr:methylmalonic aciduria and homocystinuria type D protein [Oculatellaceae cyanobacterium bins.114]